MAGGITGAFDKTMRLAGLPTHSGHCMNISSVAKSLAIADIAVCCVWCHSHHTVVAESIVHVLPGSSSDIDINI